MWFFLAVSSTLRYTLDGPMNRSGVEKISKALADATRLKIFEAISASKHMNCGEIVSMRGVTPATVSHHLKILSDEQNREKPSRWGKLAREKHQVVQFRDVLTHKYVAVSVDGKITEYGR
jgi:DNA-binding transcriptional ArsR family regulator